MTLKNLIIHYKVDEPTPQIHGNSNRLPKHALSLSSVEYVVRFLVNYTDQHAIPLPGRIPGYKNTDLNSHQAFPNVGFGGFIMSQRNLYKMSTQQRTPHLVNYGCLYFLQ